MAVQSPIPNAPERVLSTMNVDGSRRWPRPRPSHGAWWQRRRIVGWLLMAIFLTLPWVRMNGRPALLLDLPKREFLLFGARFLADALVEVPDHHRIRMRPENRAQNVMGGSHVRGPIAHRFTDGIFQRPASGIDACHVRAQ